MDQKNATSSEFTEHFIALPSIHCAGCISKIERGLGANDAVKSARVNLSLKRVRVYASNEMSTDEIVSQIENIGFEAHALNFDTPLDQGKPGDGQGLLLRVGISGFAMMNVMLLSVSVWAGAEASTRDLLHIVSAFFAIPVVVFCAQPFFKNAWRALSKGRLNMDVPISLAIILATVMSLYETLSGGEDAYFDAALSLIFFLLIGRYLDFRSRASARSAAAELSALEEKRVIRLEDGKEVHRDLKHIEVGDVLRILPGSRIPVEGSIIRGASDIDESAINGESVSRAIHEGDDIQSGTLNLTGPFDMQVTAVGANTTLRKMQTLIELAENARTKYTSLADRAAAIYAPTVHILAFAGFLVWMWITGDFRTSMTIAISTLIITCPCALGLAVPAVNTAASGKLFEKNILLKSETALERLADIDQVVFDKTGTLTIGTPKVNHIEGDADLRIALALAMASSHPLSKALHSELLARGVEPIELDIAKEVPGFGMEGTFQNTTYKLGRADWLGIETTGENTVSYFGTADNFTRVEFTDTIRKEARDVVAKLKGCNLAVKLLTGDGEMQAKRVSQELEIPEHVANVTPEGKVENITAAQSDGHKVLMVGDGFNDTAALTAAHVSMAPASAMDASRSASDLVFLGNDLNAVSDSYRIAKAAKSRILENFGLAVLYNAISIPIALMGYASPIAAALAMSSSSIIVVLNSQRIRWMK